MRLNTITILAVAVCASCVQQSGYSRSDLIERCLRPVEFGSGWVRLPSTPEDAVAARRAVFPNQRDLDAENLSRQEVWFSRGDSEYLLCYLGDSNGCGLSTYLVSRESGVGWVYEHGEITFC